MPLPKQLIPHKDNIVMGGIFLGGTYAAAVSFNLLDIEMLKGNGAYVAMGGTALALWVFYEGFIKLRKLKRRIMPQQHAAPMQFAAAPSAVDLGLAPAQPTYPQQQTPNTFDNLDSATLHINKQPAGEDIFKDFH